MVYLVSGRSQRGPVIVIARTQVEADKVASAMHAKMFKNIRVTQDNRL